MIKLSDLVIIVALIVVYSTICYKVTTEVDEITSALQY